MEDIVDIVVPIAMLAVSIATAILGSKKKKQEQQGRKSIFTPEPFDEGEEELEAEYVPLAQTIPVVEEGVPAIQDKKPEVNESFLQKEEEKPKMSREEKKKLIVYSEILKPKFDA